ncbi:MAG: hypothetical protein M1825_001585 [Sarcosagium campestre]|nr:MAG: hypothetical protein M1825_001585 [Sarcosagium campestre]
MSVASLLNPVLGTRQTRSSRKGSQSFDSTFSTPVAAEREVRSPPGPLRMASRQRAKLAKDAAIFIKSKAKGVVRYPPHENIDDEVMLREIEKAQVMPFGSIAEYARHIPYNSDKKGFFGKTGRDSFEVFQYEFSVPGEERPYVVMWDYNVGLVRITPFFKCCKYSKTTPAKMLNINAGLREVSHSITGGSIAAQGYWMPYEAAKAVAATFTYNIRYSLIPIFGTDFVDLCIEPGDPAFGRMIISPAIVRHCTAASDELRVLSFRQEIATPSPYAGKYTQSVTPRTNVQSESSPSSTPLSSSSSSSLLLSEPRRRYRDTGFWTDTEYSPSAPPRTPVKPDWAALGSQKMPPTSMPVLATWLTPSPTTRSSTAAALDCESCHKIETRSNDMVMEYDASGKDDGRKEDSGSDEASRRSSHSSDTDTIDYAPTRDTDAEAATVQSSITTPTSTRPLRQSNEIRAAKVLLELHKVDSSLGESHRRSKRKRLSSSF